MDKWCYQCNKRISEEMFKFSMKNYGKAYCIQHQPNNNGLNKQNFNNRQYKKPEPTPQTLKLGNLLKSFGQKVEFEKYDGYKHIDIAIVKSKVNIEVDGGHHNFNKVQALRDLKRTFYSWDKNFVTLRIPNSLTQEDTIEETAEYIDKFLRKDRTQLEKEIRKEYVEEGNPIWVDVNNFINGASKIVCDVTNVLSNFSNGFKLK